MKLLRDLMCLRAHGRSLFHGRRHAPDHRYVVTVPQPLPVPVPVATSGGVAASHSAADSSPAVAFRLLSSC
jgi:hypothetical protein